MNKHNQRMMKKKLLQWTDFGEFRAVVDVGSYDVNGSFREIMPSGWRYIGVDRVPGPNVDVVMPLDYEIPLLDVGIVVSASCFQYVRNPFKLMKSIEEILVPSGLVIVCAPKDEKEGLIGLPAELCPNGDPTFDCWRFLKDGMRALMEDSDLEVLEVFYHNGCCWGVAKK